MKEKVTQAIRHAEFNSFEKDSSTYVPIIHLPPPAHIPLSISACQNPHGTMHIQYTESDSATARKNNADAYVCITD
jgi:hypothetical protein